MNKKQINTILEIVSVITTIIVLVFVGKEIFAVARQNVDNLPPGTNLTGLPEEAYMLMPPMLVIFLIGVLGYALQNGGMQDDCND